MQKYAQKTIWILLIIFAMACLGTIYILVKFVQGKIDPFLLAFFRFFSASIFLFPIILLSKKMNWPDRQDLKGLVLISGLTIFPTLFIILGTAKSSTTLSAILVNTNPLFATLGAVVLGLEIKNWLKFSGLMLGIFGILITVLNGQSLDIFWAGSSSVGILYLLIASMTVALFAIFAKNYIQKYGGLYITFFTLSFASLVLFMVVFFQGSIFEIPQLSQATLLVAILIGMFATGLPYLIWNSSLKHLKISTAVSFKLLIPAFSAFYAWLFWGEEFTIWMAVGMFLISGGILMVQDSSAP